MSHPCPAVPQQSPTYPYLDHGVVQAAMHAGVAHQALDEMNKLVQVGGGNPLPAKRPPRAAASSAVNPVSESEAEEERPALPKAQVPADNGDIVSQAITRLMEVVEALAQDRTRKRSSNPLERVLEGAGPGEGGSQDSGSSVSLRRNAAARQALRDALTKQPAVLSRAVENFMREDLQSASLPGVSGRVSARAWLEHRSRIGPYQQDFRAAAGALDALRSGRPEECEARLNVLMVMLDQAAVDRLHETRDAEQVFSRILDPRWAEVALHHLRDQADFLEKRAKLNKPRFQSGQTTDADEGERERPNAKAKAKAAFRKKQEQEA